MHARLQAFDGAGGGEAEIEVDHETAGHHVAGAGAGVGIGNLEAGRREILVAGVPGGGGEFGQRRRGEMHRVLHQMRIGDVALHAAHYELGRKRTAAAVLHGVAEVADAGGFADDAEIDGLIARLERFDHAHRTVDGVAFLVRSEQQGQRKVMRSGIPLWDGAGRICQIAPADQTLHGDNAGGDRAFHVRRAAAVQIAVAHGRFEGRRGPLLQRAGGDDVGMPGEADQASRRAASRPEIRDAAGIDALDGEAQRHQPGGDQVEAASVFGRDRGSCDQRPGFFQYRHQASMFSLKSLKEPGATDLV